MNILRVKSIMNRNPSARMCSTIVVLRGQQIKLICAVSNSEYHEYYWKDFNFFISVPSNYCRTFKKYKISTLKMNFLDQKEYQIIFKLIGF
jgi:hypothetical protein